MTPDYKHNGRWATSKKINGKTVQTVSYSVWQNMLRRCKGGDSNPTYNNCTLSERFQCFQSFADWYTVQIGYGKGYQLDKDLLVKGNKVYGEDYCVLIPRDLNNFLCGSERRGTYKRGVVKSPGRDKYTAYISLDHEQTYLGSFHTEQDAHLAYCLAKKGHARLWALALSADGGYEVDQRVIDALINRDWEEI